tara:strand:+ start:191 stop:451 length:261 start_codon:yes stop_codon:yes gene_type:complete
MTILQEVFEKIIGKPVSKFAVGQRLHSANSRKVLHLKREIYVNEIRHFSALIENSSRKNTVLLSEKALKDDRYTEVDKDIKIISAL